MTIGELFAKIQEITTISEKKFLSRYMEADLSLQKFSLKKTFSEVVHNSEFVQKEAESFYEALTFCQQIILNPTYKASLDTSLFPFLIKRLELKCKKIDSKTSKHEITDKLFKKMIEVKNAALIHFPLNGRYSDDKNKFVVYCQSLGSFSDSRLAYIEMLLNQKFDDIDNLIDSIYKIQILGNEAFNERRELWPEKITLEFRNLILKSFLHIVEHTEPTMQKMCFLKNIFYEEGCLSKWLSFLLDDFDKHLRSFCFEVKNKSSEEKLDSIYEQAKKLEDFWNKKEYVRTTGCLHRPLIDFKYSCIRNLLLDLPKFLLPNQKEKLTQIFSLFKNYTPLEKAFASHYLSETVPKQKLKDLLAHFFDTERLTIKEEWKKVIREYCQSPEEFLKILYFFSKNSDSEFSFLEKLMSQNAIDEFPVFFVRHFLESEEHFLMPESRILIEKLCGFFVSSGSSNPICQCLEIGTNELNPLQIKAKLDRILKLFALAKEKENDHIKQTCLKIVATIFPYYFFFVYAHGIWIPSKPFIRIKLEPLPFNDSEIKEIISYISLEVKKEIDNAQIDLENFPQITREGFKYLIKSFPNSAFLNAFGNKTTSDIKIVCSEGAKGFLYVHSAFLSKVSSFFANMLSLSLKEGEDFAALNSESFYEMDVDADAFDFLKKWLPSCYKKNVNLESELPVFLLKQLVYANYLGMTSLVKQFDAQLSVHFEEKSKDKVINILKEVFGSKNYLVRQSFAQRMHISPEDVQKWMEEMSKFPCSNVLKRKLSSFLDVQASM